MEIKDQQPLRPADDEKKSGDLLKQRVNNFLIGYFNYLALFLAFIILAAGLFLFIYPRYQEMAKGDETARKNLQTEHEAKYSYLSSIRGLKNLYQQVGAEERKKIVEMVPADNKVINLIPEIESIVLKNGAVLNSIKIEEGLKSTVKSKTTVESGEKPEQPAGIFEQLPAGVGLARIDVILSSVNYQVLKNLLKTFENNLRLMDIAKIDFNVQENKAVFAIFSYYLLD